VLRVFSKPSGHTQRPQRHCPSGATMAISYGCGPVGTPSRSGSAYAGLTAWYGCDHSNGPDGQGSASPGATAHPGRPWSSLVSTTGSIEPPSERVNAGAFSRIGPIEILVAVLWMRDTRRGPECGPRVPQGF
jgi:hypothetical protein